MYRGFDLSILDEEAEYFISEFYSYGNSVFNKKSELINNTIESFKISGNRLDGDRMSKDWFPLINADVFISHSHNDEKLAIALGGFLRRELELEPFIDSMVWGYSANLQRMIDKVYCKKAGTVTYDYQKRNFSTSHVHMMLSVALSQMIDSTECLLFLNTPESITPGKTISGTESPWIYSELSMTNLIRKKSPLEHRKSDLAKAMEKLKKALYSEQELRMVHKVDLNNFTQIGGYDLVFWKTEYRSNPGYHSLDLLYDLCPEIV